MAWFEIDRQGLSKLLERRGKEWVVAELLQNAWDAPGVSEVSLTLEPVAGRPLVEMRVEDNSPDGFANLAHAFTIFSESVKKSDATLRGRFNLGEKLVLALCETAEISTTKGTVQFVGDERIELPRRKRERGTVFQATVRMSRHELDAALKMVRTFICPDGIQTVVNGEQLAWRKPRHSVQARLDTEIADEGGVLRRTKRNTVIDIFEPLEGHPARIYELGIPVMETGDRFDINVGQKVPLSLERDAVTPAYLRDLRAYVLNSAFEDLSSDDAAAPWVSDAIEDDKIDGNAVRAIVSARFGDKAVSYDMQDREANDRAAAAGYRVVHGGTFSKAGWEAIRSSGALSPAGRVTPTPRPFDPDGRPAENVDMTPAMQAFEGFCKEVARRTIGGEIRVSFLKTFNAAAAYGQRHLTFNVGRLRPEWFDGPLAAKHLDLLIHELAHEYESNHFSMGYVNALTKLGGQVGILALEHREIFDLGNYQPEPESGVAPRL